MRAALTTGLRILVASITVCIIDRGAKVEVVARYPVSVRVEVVRVARDAIQLCLGRLLRPEARAVVLVFLLSAVLLGPGRGGEYQARHEKRNEQDGDDATASQRGRIFAQPLILRRRTDAGMVARGAGRCCGSGD